MPALAIYKDRKYKVTWLGVAKSGEFKGQRRARISPIGSYASLWVPADQIEFIDSPSPPPVSPAGVGRGKK
jgi:hypothetical protein